MSKKRPTIADVARAAGVTGATVSYALNGGGRIGAETRSRIRLLAAELGYQPSVRAQRLRTGRSQMVALLSSMPSAISGGIARLGFFTELAVGCAEMVMERGYSLVLIPPSGSSKLPPLDLDGAILLEPFPGDPFGDDLRSRGIPFVSIGGDPGNLSTLPTIELHHRYVARILLEHLQQQGAKRIGILLGSSRRASQEVFRDIAPQFNEVVAIAEVDESSGEPGGRDAVREMLTHDPGIDALCVPIDAFATGAMQAASELGRIIGRDLLLVTRYDGLRARLATPPITALDLHLSEVSAASVSLLLHELSDGAAGSAPSIAVSLPRLIPRPSSVVH